MVQRAPDDAAVTGAEPLTITVETKAAGKIPAARASRPRPSQRGRGRQPSIPDDPVPRTKSVPPAAAAADSTPPRLLLLGDSLFAGYGLPRAEAFPARLQAALQERSKAAARHKSRQKFLSRNDGVTVLAVSCGSSKCKCNDV